MANLECGIDFTCEISMSRASNCDSSTREAEFPGRSADLALN